MSVPANDTRPLAEIIWKCRSVPSFDFFHLIFSFDFGADGWADGDPEQMNMSLGLSLQGALRQGRSGAAGGSVQVLRQGADEHEFWTAAGGGREARQGGAAGRRGSLRAAASLASRVALESRPAGGFPKKTWLGGKVGGFMC
jgi:hypothetical protein